MKEQKDFQPDETFIVMECLKCGGMAPVSTNRFKGIIPGFAIYSSKVRQCSQCMDRDNFNWITSQYKALKMKFLNYEYQFFYVSRCCEAYATFNNMNI